MAGHAMTWGETPTDDDKLWGLVAHLSVYVASFVGPLILMIVFQEKSKFIRYHAIQALVSQVALAAVAMVATFVITIIAWVTCGIGSLLYFALIPLGLVPLYGALKAYQGEWEGFPALSQLGR